MINWGIVGCGPWGIKVAAAIRALGFECQPCNRHGAFNDYRRLVEWSDIVWIAAHPDVHCEMAKRALLAGKLTVVEKPVGFNAREVKELVELSRANKVPLIVDYTYLFNPGVLALKRPDLRSLSITMGSNGPVRDYSVLWDWGSHAIAIALDFIQEPLTGMTITPCEPEGWKLGPGRVMVDLLFGTKSATITVANNLAERRVTIEANCWTNGSSPTPHYFEDTDRYNKIANPLAAVISTAARLHLRGEYFTNGALAVEVTDVLERLHAMLPAQSPNPTGSPAILEWGLGSRIQTGLK